jgi:predicted Fe-S protein YdhL (DUF1289 family)
VAVASPCLDICKFDRKFDRKADLCVGCFRTTAEIRLWRKFTDHRRRETLAERRRRETKLGRAQDTPLTALPIMAIARTTRCKWGGMEVSLGMDEAGSGPSVVLLPALSSISTRAEMRPLFQRLAAEFRVSTVDWPGFGDQARPREDW